MKNKYLIGTLILFLIFLGLSIHYYLTHGYNITYREKNNITRTTDVRGRYDQLLPVSYLEYDLEREYWGYIDLEGEVAISLTYDMAYDFDENYLAIVKKGGKYGLITPSETFILSIEYEKIQYMGNDRYYYVDDNQVGYFAQYDTNMSVIKEVTYDKVGSFTDDLAYVVRDSKVGYINQNGEEVIDLTFDYCEDFNLNFYNGYAFVYQDELFGIIDSNGDFILTPQLDEVINDYFLELDYKTKYYENYDMIPYRVDDLWGYMNVDGTVLIEPQFEEAYPCTDNNLARVKIKEGHYNFIDLTGAVISTVEYIEANDFYNGYAMTSLGNGKEGLIDHQGNIILSHEFDYVGTVNQNRILTIEYGHSEYQHLSNEELNFMINYYLGDDITDCNVIFASNEGGDIKTYVVLDQSGKRIYNGITSTYYEQIVQFDRDYIRMVAYEEEYNFEYMTYLDDNGNLLWRVYK